MGATSLSMIIKIHTDNFYAVAEKFEQIQKKYREHYGTDHYNGTWSTMNGIRIITDPIPQMSKWTNKKFRAVEDYILNNVAQKWEQAIAVKTPKGYFVVGWAAE